MATRLKVALDEKLSVTISYYLHIELNAAAFIQRFLFFLKTLLILSRLFNY